MTEYADLLKKTEEAVQGIADEGLRRIAFEQILKHELSQHSDIHHPDPDTAVHQQSPRRRKPRGGKSSQSREPSGIREDVKRLSISPDEPGLPPWTALGQIDKYLWVLEAAAKKHVDGLTAGEISSMIFDTFRENHGTNQINNLATRIKKAHVRKTKLPGGHSAWQILRSGKEHLQKLATDSSPKQ